MKYVISGLTALTLSFSAAGASLPEQLISCDAHFFSTLYAQRQALKNTLPLKQDKHHHAWFVRASENNDISWFTQPITSGKLTLTGWFQRESDLGEMGKYYFWGFVTEQSPAQVIAAMPQTDWKKSGEDYVYQPMIMRVGDKAWKNNANEASGIAPAKDSAEKLAMLGKSEGKTTLLCSVQGNVSGELLNALRPDLAGNK